ncbi:MAG: hypothetical protein ACD_3C00062G0001 [uncultured bacterium (gcode 4)]|uniref:Uncharacterized protein n=1 Tax=uncultured bacterium (gcode 4) TaxID=1234023 RepID=K2FBA3_9BACT|nr:MAG: hypothetical protein ACD_3C00062G0001 [uncultured bacterium (gcode 4)]
MNLWIKKVSALYFWQMQFYPYIELAFIYRSEYKEKGNRRCLRKSVCQMYLKLRNCKWWAEDIRGEDRCICFVKREMNITEGFMSLLRIL